MANALPAGWNAVSETSWWYNIPVSEGVALRARVWRTPRKIKEETVSLFGVSIGIKNFLYEVLLNKGLKWLVLVEGEADSKEEAFSICEGYIQEAREKRDYGFSSK